MMRILHKFCHGVVRKMTGGRMYCDKCKKYVDAVECYYDDDGVKA